MDPLKLQAAHLGLQDVSDALTQNNLVAAAGMIVENYHLYLTTVDGRVHSAEDIGNVVITVHDGNPIRIQDVALVQRGPAPAYTSITAQGRQAVLFNIESQPDASVLQIAAALKNDLARLHKELPPDMQSGVFLRPIPVRARFGRQRVERHHLWPHPVGVHPLFLPEKLGQRLDGNRHHPDFRADHHSS